MQVQQNSRRADEFWAVTAVTKRAAGASERPETELRPGLEDTSVSCELVVKVLVNALGPSYSRSVQRERTADTGGPAGVRAGGHSPGRAAAREKAQGQPPPRGDGGAGPHITRK